MSADIDVIDQLRQEIATRVRVEAGEIDPDAHFLYDLGMSSLDLLALLAFAEKSFATRFPDECLSELTTLSKISDAIHGYQQYGRRDEQ
ncbi:MAG: acyl carrier protein [Gammaproteobacteria bacterium]|nr:acyl carrier protein [Gammaproteobacteria bacterium]